MIEVPTLTFVPAQPANLAEVLETQVRRLIEIGVPKEIGVVEDKFLDGAMATASEFVFSVEFATVRLDRACFVPYDVRDRFLLEVGEVTEWTNPDKFTLFEGVTLPSGLRVVQGQFGPKYKNVAPLNVRTAHDAVEELGVPKEGLTAFLYWGKNLLRESNMDFPGAVSEYGNVPSLFLFDEKPELRDYIFSHANPYFGTVSVSRGS